MSETEKVLDGNVKEQESSGRKVAALFRSRISPRCTDYMTSPQTD